jgi:hypothetical protein
MLSCTLLSSLELQQSCTLFSCTHCAHTRRQHTLRLKRRARRLDTSSAVQSPEPCRDRRCRAAHSRAKLHILEMHTIELHKSRVEIDTLGAAHCRAAWTLCRCTRTQAHAHRCTLCNTLLMHSPNTHSRIKKIGADAATRLQRGRQMNTFGDENLQKQTRSAKNAAGSAGKTYLNSVRSP